MTIVKDSETKEIRPVYIQEAYYSAEEDINMINLAIVLVQHKFLIASFFIVFSVLGVALALFTPKTYTFSTTIEVGNQLIDGAVVPFESPTALSAKLQYNYIPLILNEHKKSHLDDKEKYKIISSVPAGSNITLLETKGTENQAGTLINFLQELSDKAVLDHNRIYKSLKTTLETRLNKATDYLKHLKDSGSENNKVEITEYQAIIETTTVELANLSNTRQVLPPLKSLNPSGISKIVIVIASALAGIFLGIFAAFFTSFASKVKQRID